jgi:hypothetical protein
MTTPHTPPRGHPEKSWQIYQAAAEHARKAAADLAAELSLDHSEVPDARVDALDRVRAVFELERASFVVGQEHCRTAREAGYSWQQIGAAITGTQPGPSPRASRQTAETGYSYANPRGTRSARAEAAPFTWTCRTCEELISDYGPTGSPAWDEQGHTAGCARLAKTIQPRDLDWEAGQ